MDVNEIFLPYSTGVIDVDNFQIKLLRNLKELHLDDEKRLDELIKVREKHYIPEEFIHLQDAHVTIKLYEEYQHFTKDEKNSVRIVNFLYMHYISIIPEMKVARATAQLLMMDINAISAEEGYNKILEVPETPRSGAGNTRKIAEFLKQLKVLLDPRYIEAHNALAIRIKNYESNSYSEDDIPIMDENALRQMKSIYNVDLTELNDSAIEGLIEALDGIEYQLYEGMDKSKAYVQEMRKKLMEFYMSKGT